jgi:hypothetical protein
MKLVKWYKTKKQAIAAAKKKKAFFALYGKPWWKK